MTFVVPAAQKVPDPHQDVFSKTTLGFWIYLMTDCILFASLFVTYGILHSSTFGGPSTHQIYRLDTALIETILLLCSSFACGLGVLASRKGNRGQILGWFILTFALGLTFVILEINEFRGLIQEGYGFDRSAFLSSFFTLVGTHGLHVSIGLLWLVVLSIQIFFKGITATTFRRMICFNLFWHFLDVVWIFIFTLVYLMGVLV